MQFSVVIKRIMHPRPSRENKILMQRMVIFKSLLTAMLKFHINRNIVFEWITKSSSKPNVDTLSLNEIESQKKKQNDKLFHNDIKSKRLLQLRTTFFQNI